MPPGSAAGPQSAKPQKHTARYQSMDLRVEGHQIAKSLHKQDIPRFELGCGLLIRLVQEPRYYVAEGAQLVALLKVRSQQLGKSKGILPVRNQKKNLFFYLITVDQHTPLMAARAEVACLAAEGERVIMVEVIAVDASETLVQIAAVDKPVQGTVLKRQTYNTRLCCYRHAEQTSNASQS